MPRPKFDLELQRARLLYYLNDGQWHKAKELPLNNRAIRLVCAQWPWQFISTQRGYKLAKHATIAEMEEARADLTSRIVHLSKRAHGISKAITDRQQDSLL